MKNLNLLVPIIFICLLLCSCGTTTYHIDFTIDWSYIWTGIVSFVVGGVLILLFVCY